MSNNLVKLSSVRPRNGYVTLPLFRAGVPAPALLTVDGTVIGLVVAA